MSQSNERALTAAEVKEMREGAVPNISIATRQVAGGYIVTGRIVWSKDGNPVAVQTDEAVATTYQDVASLVERYHDAFEFTYRYTLRDALRESQYNAQYNAAQDTEKTQAADSSIARAKL